jgi:hypothetical protein
MTVPFDHFYPHETVSLDLPPAPSILNSKMDATLLHLQVPPLPTPSMSTTSFVNDAKKLFTTATIALQRRCSLSANNVTNWDMKNPIAIPKYVPLFFATFAIGKADLKACTVDTSLSHLPMPKDYEETGSPSVEDPEDPDYCSCSSSFRQ